MSLNGIEITEAVKSRFHSKVRESTELYFSGTPCEEWVASCFPTGYGQFWLGTTQYAHRVAILLRYGSIPEDLQVNHKCRNKRCVNTAHLELLTSAEHMRADSDLRKLPDKKWCVINGQRTGRRIGLANRKNRSLPEGVAITKLGTYTAYVWLPKEKKQVYVGTFKSPDEASMAYVHARREAWS
jgi:hypothetical protein